jgi:predicted PhzF superfamily epimerase YddE/YHI9
VRNAAPESPSDFAGSLFHVAAFAAPGLEGNLAGVVVLENAVDGPWMQRIAAHAGHAATAFVTLGKGSPHRLRWFSPTNELALCGHGTLAAAHVLAEYFSPTALAFSTAAGRLVVRRDDALFVRFPAIELREARLPDELAKRLPGQILRVAIGLDHVVELAGADDVRAASPPLALVEAIGSRGLVLTARARGLPADIVSRFFSPQTGIPEDAATGSAHIELLAFWSAILRRDALIGHQLSSRGGEVLVRAVADGVEVGGRAITVDRTPLR